MIASRLLPFFGRRRLPEVVHPGRTADQIGDAGAECVVGRSKVGECSLLAETRAHVYPALLPATQGAWSVADAFLDFRQQVRIIVTPYSDRRTLRVHPHSPSNRTTLRWDLVVGREGRLSESSDPKRQRTQPSLG